jgi:polygalacturonase
MKTTHQITPWMALGVLSVTLVTVSSAAPLLPNINTNNIINITNAPYYARGNGATDNTAAIQSAINAASSGGLVSGAYGGTVEIPGPGTYLCGPINMANNVNLQIDSGAILKMLPYASWPGTTTFIACATKTNFSITGRGKIDGQATFGDWWDGRPTSARPYLVYVTKSSQMLFQDITVVNPPKMHFAFKSGGGNITFRRITINTPDSPNTDGIDLTGTNCLVQDCIINAGDDNIALGTSSGGVPSSDILVTNCAFGIGHGVSIGSNTQGGVSNLTVINCTFNGTDNGIRMKSDNATSGGSGQGGIAQNLYYYNIGMTNIRYAPILIYSYYKSYGNPTIAGITPPDAANTPVATSNKFTPIWRNIVISNLTATAAQPGMIWARTECPAANIVLSKVNITASDSYPFEVYNAQQVQILNSQFHLGAGATENYWLFNANVALSDTNTLGVGSLTMADSLLAVSNNLALHPATALDYTLDLSTNCVAVMGNLVLGGTINAESGAGFGPGTNTLLTYTGTLSGSATLGSTPGGPFTYRLDTGVAGQVNLVVVSTNDFLSASALLEGPTAGSDGVVLTAIGPWGAKANAAWLHLGVANQSGTDSANVIFNYDANPGATRTGTLTIAGRTLTVMQAGSAYVAAPVTALASSGLNQPFGVAVDGAGNVYFSDCLNNAIKKWTAANNTVTTLVASNATTPLYYPHGVAVDGAGNVYIADTYNNAIKKWTMADNTVTALVSSGLYYPYGVAVDAAGNIYVADTENSAIKKWTAADQTVTTLFSVGKYYAYGVAVDGAGNVYTPYGATIVKWTAADQTLTTLVSSGLSYPYGVALDGLGNVYIADTYNNSIKKWTAANNTVSTLASSGSGYSWGVAVDGAGNVYFSNSGNNTINELPRAFVDPTARWEGSDAGSDMLPAVLPATVSLLAPFAPASDQPWLTISGINHGVVSLNFTANPGNSNRTAHVTLLGQSIPVTQTSTSLSPTLVNPGLLGNGSFRFAFSNNSGASFTVLTSTNLLLPMASWTVAGVPVNIAPGAFQFTTTITSGPPRFYRVRSP